MKPQASKRKRDLARGRSTYSSKERKSSPASRPFNRAGWVYRQVDESDADILRDALKIVSSENALDTPPLYNFFTLTLVYPKKIERSRRYSKLENPASLAKITRQLGDLSLESFGESVVAELGDVKPYTGTIGVEASYRGLETEQKALSDAVQDILQLPARAHITSSSPHISIGKGRIWPRGAQLIQEVLPAQIKLLPAQFGE